MKNFILILFSLCLLSTASLGENAITAANSQRLVFKAQPNEFDDYNSVFVAFDKGANIMQSYEKLASMHAIKPVKKGFAEVAGEASENVLEKGVADKNADFNQNAQNDADGCACYGLTPKIAPYKDFHHKGNTYLWQGDKKLIIKRECWGSGHFYFELEALNSGTKITTKFSRD